MKSIKKQWLVSFLILIGIVQLLNLLKLVEATELVRTIARILLVLPIWSCITYHCAYRKHGTRWLTWLLIIFPIWMLQLPIEFIQGEIPVAPLEKAIGWILIGITFGIYLWFWSNCLLLRKENIALKNNPDNNGALSSS